MPRNRPEQLHRLKRKPSALYVAYNAILAASFHTSGFGNCGLANNILSEALRTLNSEYTKQVQEEVLDFPDD